MEDSIIREESTFTALPESKISAKDREELIRQIYKTNMFYTTDKGDKKKIGQSERWLLLHDTYTEQYPIFSNGETLFQFDGYYRKFEEKDFRKKLFDILSPIDSDAVMPRTLGEMYKTFLTSGMSHNIDIEPMLTFFNGHFNYQTGEWQKPSSAIHTMNCFPYNYDTSITAPPAIWSDFLHNLVPDPIQRIKLEAYLYYLLTPDVTQVQQALFLIGEPQCGKNTLMDILGIFFPSQSYNTKSFESMAKYEFGESFFKDKWYNWSDEAESISFDHTVKNKFKEWVGKTHWTVNEKNTKQLVYFDNKCRFIFTANFMPPKLGADKAVRSRILIIECIKRYIKADPSIKDKMPIAEIISYLINTYWRTYQQILGQRADDVECDQIWTALLNPMDRFKDVLQDLDDLESFSSSDEIYNAFTQMFPSRSSEFTKDKVCKYIASVAKIPRRKHCGERGFQCRINWDGWAQIVNGPLPESPPEDLNL